MRFGSVQSEFDSQHPDTSVAESDLSVNILSMHYLYIIECKEKTYYTGITWNLEKRMREHNLRTKTCLQKSKIPVKLVYSKKFEDKFQAAREEKKIKGWNRKKKQELINSLH